MSIPFSDTANLKGLVQFYEKECGFDYGDISGNTTKLKEFAAEVNLGIDDFWSYVLPLSGKWRLDDSNHTGEPQILANIVSGTRKYSILQDASSNLALEVFKVFVLPSATATQYQEVYPYDAKLEDGIDSFTDGLNQGGIPGFYNKEGMDIYFDLVPNYSVANGVKILISREGSYFLYTDTTKKPGVPGLFHKYFYLKPAENYTRIHRLDSHSDIKKELDEVVESMATHFGKRAQDEKPVLKGRQQEFM